LPHPSSIKPGSQYMSSRPVRAPGAQHPTNISDPGHYGRWRGARCLEPSHSRPHRRTRLEPLWPCGSIRNGALCQVSRVNPREQLATQICTRVTFRATANPPTNASHEGSWTIVSA